MKKYKKNIIHCCHLMDTFTRDPRVGISYSKVMREYYIDLIDSPAKQCAVYCPFCGDKLPSSVRDQYFEILEKEYQIDHPRYEEQAKRIPEEFKSDEWWKKRGL